MKFLLLLAGVAIAESSVEVAPSEVVPSVEVVLVLSQLKLFLTYK